MHDRMTDADVGTPPLIVEFKLEWPGATATMMPMPMPMPSEPTDPFACCLPGGGSTHELVFDPNGGSEFWVSGQNYDHIARVTLQGVPTFFAMPPGSLPHGSVFDHQGRLWVTFEGLGQIACIDGEGNIVDTVDVALHSEGAREPFNTRPHGLTIAVDGALWFTGKLTNTVGRVSPDGQVQHFLLPTIGAVPIYVAPDGEGGVWCTELGGSRVARIGRDGSVSEYPTPTPNSRPITIKAGPDGKSMWFTEEAGGRLGRIDPAAPHDIAEFPVPLTRRDAILAGHTFDRAGNLWVQQYISPPAFGPTGDDYIIRFDKAINDAPPGDLSGVAISYFEAPSQRTVMHRITLGPDGNIWFSELGLNQIGRITL